MQWIARGALAITLAISLHTPARAQSFQSFGDYQFHYSALPTGLLTPEIAGGYGIVRSRNRGLVTVSLLNGGKPVAAVVTARATNLAGQLRQIEMREIREADAIYYIGTFSMADRENLHFELEVKPDGYAGKLFAVDFTQQFFTED